MKKPTLVPSGSHFSQYYTLTCLALPRESTGRPTFVAKAKNWHVQGFTRSNSPVRRWLLVPNLHRRICLYVCICLYIYIQYISITNTKRPTTAKLPEFFQARTTLNKRCQR